MEQLLKGPAFRRASLRTLQEFLSRQNGVLTFWKGKLRDSGKGTSEKCQRRGKCESGEIPECLPIYRSPQGTPCLLEFLHPSWILRSPGQRPNHTGLTHVLCFTERSGRVAGGACRRPSHPIQAALIKCRCFTVAIQSREERVLPAAASV